MRRASLRGGLEYIRLGIQWLNRMHIPQLAANTGYFIVLSVFPALLLVLSALSYTGLTVENLLEMLEGVLPQALMGTARQLILSVYKNASGAVAGVSALTAIWSSSRGVYGLLTGLNAIYGVSEDRGYLYTRFISVLYTFALEAVILLTLVLHVFGNSLLKFIRSLNLPAMTVLMDNSGPALCVPAAGAEPAVYADVHDPSQPAQPLLGEPARRAAGLHRLAAVFQPLLRIRNAFPQLRQYLRLRVRHCHQHAVALLLPGDHLLRRRAESAAGKIFGFYKK